MRGNLHGLLFDSLREKLLTCEKPVKLVAVIFNKCCDQIGDRVSKNNKTYRNSSILSFNIVFLKYAKYGTMCIYLIDQKTVAVVNL